MSRKLNLKQKKLLNVYLNELINSGINIENKLYANYDNLPSELINKLELINNYETVWSDTERYLNDQLNEYLYGKVK